MRATILTLSCVLGIALSGAAWANSVYSVGGLGEPVLEEQARIRALGGSGVAEHGPREVSLVNPASLAEVEHLILEGTILPEMRRVSTLSFPTETAQETIFPSLRAAIALPGRIALGGAYVAALNAAFRVQGAASAGAPSAIQVDGSGGMNYVRVSLARSVNRQLRLGVDYDFIVGHYLEHWTRTYADSGIQQGRDTLDTNWEKKGRVRLGAQWVRGDFALGGVYELSRELTLESTRRAYGVNIKDPPRTLTLPSGFTVGFSAPVVGRLRAVAQYRRFGWDRSSLQSDLVDFRAEQRFSVGLERKRSTEEGHHFSGRIPLRLGGYYLEWPDLLPVAGATDVRGGVGKVDEWGVTLGTGLMSQDRGGSIDFSLEAGSRGNRDTLGASEKFLRFAVSLLVSDETWKGSFHR